MTRIVAVIMAAFMFAAFGNAAQAGNRPVVEAFYAELLNGAAKAPDALPERANRILAPDWASIGDYTGKTKSREQFVKQLQGFGKLIPDLAWSVEEVLEAGNRVVVRGRATGTPAGEFFGVPPAGKRFDIMSIDIHTVVDGKIVESHHVEDWAGAIRQLRAP